MKKIDSDSLSLSELLPLYFRNWRAFVRTVARSPRTNSATPVSCAISSHPLLVSMTRHSSPSATTTPAVLPGLVLTISARTFSSVAPVASWTLFAVVQSARVFATRGTTVA